MKKVCIIGPFPPPMTGNSKALDTIENSSVFSSKYEIIKVNISTKLGASFHEKGKNVIRIINKIKQETKERKPDLYYITTAQSKFGVFRDFLYIKTIKNNNKKAKIVCHMHGGGFRTTYLNSNFIIRKMIDWIYKEACMTIVLSESLVSMFEDVTDPSKLEIVYNCVDDVLIPDGEFVKDKIEMMLKKKPLNIGYLSNMIPSKGYDIVLSVACNYNDDVNYMFAGSFRNESEKDEFFSKISKTERKNKIKYYGIISGAEKIDFLRNIDIFILPTRYPPEGQPISIMEAMANGAAVITTNQGGICDIVENGVNGIILHDEAIEKVHKALASLIEDRETMAIYMWNNYQKAISKFTENNYINQLIRLFDKVLANNEK